MRVYSEEERRILDDIHKRKFEDITPEEVALYAEWKADIEADKRESETVNSMLLQQMQASKDMYLAQAELARQQLKQLIKEGMTNGQQEQE